MRYFAYIFSSVLIFYFLVQNFLSFPLKRKEKIVLFSFLSVIHYVLTPYLSQLYILFLLAGILLFIYKCSPNPYKDIFCFLIGYFYNMVFNAFLLNIYTLLFGTKIYEIKEPLLFPYLYFVLSYITTKYLGPKLHKFFDFLELRLSPKIFIPFFINLLLCILLCVFNIIYGERIGYSTSTILFNAIIFLSYFVISTFLLFQIYRYTKEDEQKKYLEEQYLTLTGYTKELENAYEHTRKIKHDYDNILISISEYLKENRYQELQKYCQTQLLPFANDTKGMPAFLSELDKIQLPEIKGLLAAKFLNAYGKGIRIHLNIEKPISSLPVPVLILVRILGIFLDNAVEASEESAEKIIETTFIHDRESIIISIANSTKPLTVPVSKLCASGYSTRGKNRGIGLSNASDIISGFPEITWTTEYHGFMFSQILEIEVQNI